MIAVKARLQGGPLNVTIYWALAGAMGVFSAAAASQTPDINPGAPAAVGAAQAAGALQRKRTPLAAQEAALRTSLAPTAAVVSRTAESLELWYSARLAFVADGTELQDSAMKMLDLLARSLKDFPHTAIVIAVYTDSIGSSDYNQQQSQARAAAVVDYLVTKGIASERLVATGVGETVPLEAENTPEGRDLNRRLQVVITPLS
jgi:outer membrane protein OmpA-like peptidoglycan-associated protein